MSWDGYVYKGPFSNGMFNGFGLIRTPEGIFQGNFVNGSMVSGSPINSTSPSIAAHTVRASNINIT